jgi:hypothetical protein
MLCTIELFCTSKIILQLKYAITCWHEKKSISKQKVDAGMLGAMWEGAVEEVAPMSECGKMRDWKPSGRR